MYAYLLYIYIWYSYDGMFRIVCGYLGQWKILYYNRENIYYIIWFYNVIVDYFKFITCKPVKGLIVSNIYYNNMLLNVLW